jgi:hypothetical protein
MPRMIDQIRASKLPSSMMQFAARGALQVPAAENIEIMVYLARHNKVFGDLARMTLAGWDEKACAAAAADPQTPREVLEYFVAPDNLRPKLLPALVGNPSVSESALAKLAISALRESIEVMLKSPRVCSLPGVLEALRGNPYLKKEETEEIERLTHPHASGETVVTSGTESPHAADSTQAPAGESMETGQSVREVPSSGDDEQVSAYLQEHAQEIAAEADKPFQAIGGVVELLGAEYFPITQQAELPAPEAAHATSAGTAAATAKAHPAMAGHKKPHPPGEPKRENTLQKINSLDVKGRIQLALKGNKEERSILIRDGTKVVALAVLEAPKLSDGEVEKFASQKNVLEAVLRQIPLKRRFVKNYIVVRNLVANPRTPLDLGLGLMKNLLAQDLKNLSANKEVSETIRKLALKMFKQKTEEANKKK